MIENSHEDSFASREPHESIIMFKSERNADMEMENGNVISTEDDVTEILNEVKNETSDHNIELEDVKQIIENEGSAVKNQVKQGQLLLELKYHFFSMCIRV